MPMDKFFAQLQKDSRPDGNPTRPSGDAGTESQDGASNNTTSDAAAGADGPKKLPKGVVLGKDGKPCVSFMLYCHLTWPLTSFAL